MPKKLFSRIDNLLFKFEILEVSKGTKKDPYHLNYEQGRYREKELVHIIRDAIPHFALTHDEYSELKENDDIGEMNRLGWSRISKTRKECKGDFGELLLFLILSHFYKSQKLVTKVKLRSSRNEQVKGFDCAHFISTDEETSLWLGEAKFYKDFSNALQDILTEIKTHTEYSYLNNELTILAPNIEWNHKLKETTTIEEYINKTRSLDDLKIVIPSLITYETSILGKFNTTGSKIFKEAFLKHFKQKFKTIDSKPITLPENFSLFFILLPLQDVNSIKHQLERIEEANS